jgi:hypothetical protein
MNTTKRTILKTSLATSLAVVATGSGVVMAAAPYTFVGSDTLTQVIQRSIVNGGFSSSLVYNNTGSGAAENALKATPPSQRIAPMSRNFKADVLSAHPGWKPQLANIIGLDGAVIVQKGTGGGGYSQCANLLAPLMNNTQVTAAGLQLSAKPYALPDSLIGLILGGVGGEGTTAACSAKARLDAIDAAAACFGGISTIDHFYRRDDRSGTADSMKEKYRIKRFCSGRAPGLVSGADNNMANDDADPIRRYCQAGSDTDPTYKKTPCTLNWPTGGDCSNTPNAAGCTQGLTVALSQNDPGQGDITLSIAQRVRKDNNNQTMGFAGRAGAAPYTAGINNAAINVNGISPNDFNIRTSAYLSARRLYVNYSDQVVGLGRAGGRTADDIANETAQENLFGWMTNPDVGGGRSNVDPILSAVGFLPCTDDFSDPNGSGNLCSSALPPPDAESTPPQCIPDGQSGNGTNVCCGDGAVTTGTCPVTSYCAASTAACYGSGKGNCCAGTCNDQGTGNGICS